MNDKFLLVIFLRSFVHCYRIRSSWLDHGFVDIYMNKTPRSNLLLSLKYISCGHCCIIVLLGLLCHTGSHWKYQSDAQCPLVEPLSPISGTQDRNFCRCWTLRSADGANILRFPGSQLGRWGKISRSSQRPSHFNPVPWSAGCGAPHPSALQALPYRS